MITKTKFLAVSGLMVALGWTLSGPITSRLHQHSPSSSAAWLFGARDLSELVRYADVIAVAKHTVTYPGRVAVDDSGQDDLPFELNDFEIRLGMKGARASDHLLVERAGGITADGDQVNIDADGGDFETAATYLLFLKQQEDGSFHYQINDQARFQVVDGRLAGVEEHDPVSRTLNGKTLREAIDLISAELRD